MDDSDLEMDDEDEESMFRFVVDGEDQPQHPLGSPLRLTAHREPDRLRIDRAVFPLSVVRISEDF